MKIQLRVPLEHYITHTNHNQLTKCPSTHPNSPLLIQHVHVQVQHVHVHVLPACCASACHSLLPFSIGYSDFPWIYLLHSPLLKVTGPSAVIHSFSQRHTDKRTGTVVLRSIAKRCSFLPRDVQLYDSVKHSSDCETHTHSHWVPQAPS